jgi:hypothetical protein
MFKKDLQRPAKRFMTGETVSAFVFIGSEGACTEQLLKSASGRVHFPPEYHHAGT